jgi:hypothetical protein
MADRQGELIEDVLKEEDWVKSKWNEGGQDGRGEWLRVSWLRLEMSISFSGQGCA